MTDRDFTDEHQTTVRRRRLILLVLLVASIGLVLIAQFPLDNWAESNNVHHEMQHGLIFIAGIGVGISLLGLYQSASEETAD